MTPIEAQNVLIAHLQSMPDVPPIAYENGPVVTALPRIVLSLLTVPQRPAGLDGTEVGDAQIVARIEVEDGAFSGEAEGIATSILTHFSAYQTFDGIKILRQPTVQTRYPDDGVYHMPILIQGWFHT